MKAKSLVAINKRKETQRKDGPARACNHNLERKKHAQAAFQTPLGGPGDTQKLSRGLPNRRRSCMGTGQEKRRGSHVCTMEFQKKVGRSHNSSSRSKKDKLPRPIMKEICFKWKQGNGMESGKMNTTTPIVNLNNLQDAGCFLEMGNGEG